VRWVHPHPFLSSRSARCCHLEDPRLSQ